MSPGNVIADADGIECRQWMIVSDHADKAIAKQCLNTNFRSHITEHANFKIHQAFTQGARAFLGFGRKTQTHLRRRFGNLGNQRRAERFDKTVVGTHDKDSLQFGQIK
ncbi:hypothetical protein D3C87_1648400 [compost metagenome]